MANRIKERGVKIFFKEAEIYFMDNPLDCAKGIYILSKTLPGTAKSFFDLDNNVFTDHFYFNLSWLSARFYSREHTTANKDKYINALIQKNHILNSRGAKDRKCSVLKGEYRHNSI